MKGELLKPRRWAIVCTETHPQGKADACLSLGTTTFDHTLLPLVEKEIVIPFYKTFGNRLEFFHFISIIYHHKNI